MNGFTRRFSAVSVALATVLAGVQSARADLASSSGTYTSSVALTGVPASVTTTSSGVPYNNSHFAMLGEPPTYSASATDYDFSTLENWTTFNFFFTHDRDGSAGSSAQSNGTLLFTLDSAGPMFFSLDGFYGLTGRENIFLYVLLFDETANSVLFSNTQESRSTQDQEFMLGLQDGDFDNGLAGGLNGSLAAGHTYSLTYIYGISNAQTGSAASAGGFLSLQLRPSVVPAPSAVLLGAIGLASLISRRRQSAV